MSSPGWSEHVVNIVLLLAIAHIIDTATFTAHNVAIGRRPASHCSFLAIAAASLAPELGHSSKLILEHLIVLVNESTHVGFEA